MKAKHVHDLGSLKIVKVIADSLEYKRDKYGDWSFIVRYCPCGYEEPMEYGQRKNMEKHLAKLIS
jgi:hypothetical protein